MGGNTTQSQRRLFFGLRKERERLERTGVEADTRTLASRLRVKEGEIVAMLERFAGGEMSLDAPARSQEANASTIGDGLSDVAPRPDQLVEDAEFTQALNAKLELFGAGLQGREAQIFRGRLLSAEPMTLTELASTCGVSPERVRQIEQRLKTRIRHYLQKVGDEVDSPAEKGRRAPAIARSGSNSAAPRLERPIVLQDF